MKKSRCLALAAIIATMSLAGMQSPTQSAQQRPAQQKVEALPPDVYPESFSRIPRAKRSDLKTEEERQAFDRVAGTNPSTAPAPLGPTGTRLHFPIAAELYRDAARWIRDKSGLEPAIAQLAILVATREANGLYEWNAHEPEAKEAGISQETIDIVKGKKGTRGLPEKHEVLIRFGREMAREPKVTSKTFADAERVFGRKNTLAITILIGHYMMSSMMLRTYDQRLSPDQDLPFPAP